MIQSKAFYAIYTLTIKNLNIECSYSYRIILKNKLRENFRKAVAQRDCGFRLRIQVIL